METVFDCHSMSVAIFLSVCCLDPDIRFDSPFACVCWALGPRCVHRSYSDLLQQGRCQPTCYKNVINYVNGLAVGIRRSEVLSI